MDDDRSSAEEITSLRETTVLRALKHYYRLLRLAWTFIVREELKSPTPVPFGRRVSLVLRGYHGHVWNLYNLKDYRLSDYLSDWQKARMSMMYDSRNVRAGYQYGLNNKIFSTALLGEHLRTPRIYAIVEHGQLLSLCEAAGELFAGSWLDACVRAGGRLVFKPVAEGRGRGIFILAESNGQLELNGVPTSEASVADRLRSLNEYLIVEHVRQGEYAQALYPDTTNTIRMITVIDPEEKRAYPSAAVQRIGRRSSRPVDNWNQGGLCAAVDLQTGELSRAAARETSKRQLAWHENHPDTGVRITGLQVPNWQYIKQTITAAASRMAYYKYLSWDIVSLDDGIAVLEADTVSGIETLQVHRPMLKDERVRRCLQGLGYAGP